MNKKEYLCLLKIIDKSIDFWNKACAETKNTYDREIILALIMKLSNERTLLKAERAS